MDNILKKLDRFFDKGFQIAVLNLERGGRWITANGSKIIPYLKAANAKGNHIIIQPVDQPSYLLADDITPELLRRHHQYEGKWRPGRMVVETSPDNYQVWIHSDCPVSLDQKRYWLKRLKSDPGADPHNRWGRCPGFRNRKEKYRTQSGGYPLARLIWIDWKQRASIPLLNLPPSASIAPTLFSPPPPKGDVCQSFPISRGQYERGDESATDFAYAMALIRRGASDYFVQHALSNERHRWENHKGKTRQEAYLRRSIRRARRWVEAG
jgi:hypothetical protein